MRTFTRAFDGYSPPPPPFPPSSSLLSPTPLIHLTPFTCTAHLSPVHLHCAVNALARSIDHTHLRSSLLPPLPHPLHLSRSPCALCKCTCTDHIIDSVPTLRLIYCRDTVSLTLARSTLHHSAQEQREIGKHCAFERQSSQWNVPLFFSFFFTAVELRLYSKRGSLPHIT